MGRKRHTPEQIIRRTRDARRASDGFPASCKDRKQSPALAIAASQDREFGRDGRIQAIFDI